jgi:hypothetical protein
VAVKTLETTPTGETHWSTRTMAANAGMSHTMIGRIWRAFGLQPHVTRSFKLSPDPRLVDKVQDVVGLYMKSKLLPRQATPELSAIFEEATLSLTVDRELSDADHRASFCLI